MMLPMQREVNSSFPPPPRVVGGFLPTPTFLGGAGSSCDDEDDASVSSSSSFLSTSTNPAFRRPRSSAHSMPSQQWQQQQLQRQHEEEWYLQQQFQQFQQFHQQHQQRRQQRLQQGGSQWQQQERQSSGAQSSGTGEDDDAGNDDAEAAPRNSTAIVWGDFCEGTIVTNAPDYSSATVHAPSKALATLAKAHKARALVFGVQDPLADTRARVLSTLPHMKKSGSCGNSDTGHEYWSCAHTKDCAKATLGFGSSVPVAVPASNVTKLPKFVQCKVVTLRPHCVPSCFALRAPLLEGASSSMFGEHMPLLEGASSSMFGEQMLPPGKRYRGADLSLGGYGRCQSPRGDRAVAHFEDLYVKSSTETRAYLLKVLQDGITAVMFPPANGDSVAPSSAVGGDNGDNSEETDDTQDACECVEAAFDSKWQQFRGLAVKNQNAESLLRLAYEDAKLSLTSIGHNKSYNLASFTQTYQRFATEYVATRLLTLAQPSVNPNADTVYAVEDLTNSGFTDLDLVKRCADRGVTLSPTFGGGEGKRWNKKQRTNAIALLYKDHFEKLRTVWDSDGYALTVQRYDVLHVGPFITATVVKVKKYADATDLFDPAKFKPLTLNPDPFAIASELFYDNGTAPKYSVGLIPPTVLVPMSFVAVEKGRFTGEERVTEKKPLASFKLCELDDNYKGHKEERLRKTSSFYLDMVANMEGTVGDKANELRQRGSEVTLYVLEVGVGLNEDEGFPWFPLGCCSELIHTQLNAVLFKWVREARLRVWPNKDVATEVWLPAMAVILATIRICADPDTTDEDRDNFDFPAGSAGSLKDDWDSAVVALYQDYEKFVHSEWFKITKAEDFAPRVELVRIPWWDVGGGKRRKMQTVWRTSD